MAFCFSPHSSSPAGTMLLVSQFTKDPTSIASEQQDSGAESEEGETAESQPLSEIETKGMHYTHAFGTY